MKQIFTALSLLLILSASAQDTTVIYRQQNMEPVKYATPSASAWPIKEMLT